MQPSRFRPRFIQSLGAGKAWITRLLGEGASESFRLSAIWVPAHSSHPKRDALPVGQRHPSFR